jgi:uncharacterized protein YoxC
MNQNLNISLNGGYLPSLANSRKDLLKEFNANYREYLENSLLYLIFTELASSVPAAAATASKCEHSSYSNLISSEKKIQEAFFKSYLISNIESTTTKTNNLMPPEATLIGERNADELSLIEGLKFEPLDENTKMHLLGKIESRLESRLIEMIEFIDPNIDKELNGDDLWQNDYAKVDELLDKVKELSESISVLDGQCEKAYEEVALKLGHFLNLSVEIAGLIKAILEEFKLKLYAEENKLTSKSQILKCEMFIAKTNVLISELLNDTYSSDKLQSFKIIKNQMQINANKLKETIDQINASLSMFKSFGKEFEAILASYNELKLELERKKYTLNRLKTDSVIYN